MCFLPETDGFLSGRFVSYDAVYSDYIPDTAKESPVLPLFFLSTEISGIHNRFSAPRKLLLLESNGLSGIGSLFHLGCLLPDKRMLIGTAFQFCSIDEYGFLWQFSDGFQTAEHLIKKIFADIYQKSRTKTCTGAVIWCFLSGKQPHKVDIASACWFDLSGWINVLGIHIGQDLEHGLGVHCRIFAFGRVNLI